MVIAERHASKGMLKNQPSGLPNHIPLEDQSRPTVYFPVITHFFHALSRSSTLISAIVSAAATVVF
jgi:hypothetical protein